MLVIRERIDRVEVLTLNRPEAANSLNPPLMAELGAALGEILEDADVRAVVITGAGERVFCAGMDLAALGDWSAAGDQPGGEVMTAFMEGSFPRPLIAAVNGAAVGGGLELMLGCDLTVAAEHARFGLPEVKRGLYPAGGGTLLSTRVPLALALEMGMTGRLIDSHRAVAVGLVNQVVPADELLGAATALAGEIAANGPLAVQLTKRLMRDTVTVGPHAGRATAEQADAVLRSEDAAEGTAAFMERLSPRFVGR